MLLVVPEGFPDPDGPVIPFRDLVWWVALVVVGFGGPKGIS